MNSSKHTPGPWEFFTEGSPIRGLQKKYLKSSSTGQGFAHTVGLREPTDTANARLIAAAPEMLDALELAARWLANSLPAVDLGGPRPLPVVLTAISKARGTK